MDEGETVGVTSLDFSKVFGIVSCSILKTKLMRCGLGKWTGGKLARLPGKVVSTKSIWQTVTNGIPQGSIAGLIRLY